MARIAYQPTNQFFDSLISHSRIALLGLMALGLAACNSGSNDADNDTTPPSFTLPAPSNLMATAGDEAVALSWTAVTGASDYCVYVSENADIHLDTANSYDTGLSECLGDANTGHTVTGLINGTAYYFVVTASDGNVESAASSEVTATPEAPVVTASRPLNDTGIDWCADGSTNNQGCPVDDYPGQDGDHGRDAAARDDTLTKVGAGAAGFDFTKLDASGNDLAADATEWSCVRDNHTGLIWEVKVDNTNHLRHKDHTYTWYNPDSATNGGSAGTQGGTGCNSTLAQCNTDAFVQAVNAQGLCGASDWRLPTVEELLSIVHNGRASAPRIDVGYFPNTSSSWFWSSSPDAYFANYAWVVSFGNGSVDWDDKDSSLRVRLVRAGQ